MDISISKRKQMITQHIGNLGEFQSIKKFNLSFSKDFSMNFLDRFNEGFYIDFEIVEKEIKLDKVLLLPLNNNNLSKSKLSFDYLHTISN